MGVVYLQEPWTGLYPSRSSQMKVALSIRCSQHGYANISLLFFVLLEQAAINAFRYEKISYLEPLSWLNTKHNDPSRIDLIDKQGDAMYTHLCCKL